MLGKYVRVIIVGIEGEINLGFIARLVKNFDVDDLYLVSPAAKISDEAKRFAAKAVDVLNRVVVVKSIDEALKGLDISACTSAKVGGERDVLRHPITPWDFADLALTKNRIGVVFGRESVGLTREEIAKCDLLITIPANPEYPVLNLSHAVATILYELYKTFGKSQVFYEVASREIIDRIIKYFEEVVAKLETDERRRNRILASFKRILFKANPNKAEAYNILYVMRKIYVKIGERSSEVGDNY